jgi:hypothetical protein|tara:strand:+ start:437 stop:934 length:498 start_codon:yes stop_codon:yes gene_type:complete
MKNNETKVTEEIKTEVTEEVIRDSRASEDRNATANEVVWTPPSSLDAPPAPDGFHHRWIRSESLGFNDNKNITGKLRSGYALVRSEEYKDSNYPIVEDGKYKGVIGVGGLLLARIPIEIAKARQKYYSDKAKDNDDAVKSDLLRDQHPSMPISYDSRSSKSFGGK